MAIRGHPDEAWEERSGGLTGIHGRKGSTWVAKGENMTSLRKDNNSVLNTIHGLQCGASAICMVLRYAIKTDLEE